MKKIIFLLVFLIYIDSTIAGVGKTVQLDFLKENEQAIIMQENDRVEFDLLDGEHTIIVDKIKDEGVDFDIFPYCKNVYYVSLNMGDAVKIDLNNDREQDLRIRIFALDNKNKKVVLIFERLINGNEITGASVGVKDEENWISTFFEWIKKIFNKIF